MVPTLEVNRLDKRFGDLHAVCDLSFSVAPGETFGLLGPNGAGKTTTIAMVCGLSRPDSGSIVVQGVPIRPGSIRGRDLIGYVPQEIALYPELTAWENLRFFARLYGLRGRAASSRIEETLAIVGLTDRAGDAVSTYSGGMQRRLNIAAGMLHSPRLLILDEPTVGVDPQSRNAILDAVAALSDEGISVLYTTHYMEEAERLCDRIAIVDHGRLLACGTRRELVATVGEHDQLVLTLAGAAAEAARHLQTYPGVRTAQARDDRVLECMVDDASTLLPGLLTHLAALPASITEIAVCEPSLDSVFLHITGTALRD